MSEIMTENLNLPTLFASDSLSEIIARETKSILAVAVQADARQWLAERSELRDQRGRSLVVAEGLSGPIF